MTIGLEEEKEEVLALCSRCAGEFRELKCVIDWMKFHPSRLPVCIGCDPVAGCRPCIVITEKGARSLERPV